MGLCHGSSTAQGGVHALGAVSTVHAAGVVVVRVAPPLHEQASIAAACSNATAAAGAAAGAAATTIRALVRQGACPVAARGARALAPCASQAAVAAVAAIAAARGGGGQAAGQASAAAVVRHEGRACADGAGFGGGGGLAALHGAAASVGAEVVHEARAGEDAIDPVARLACGYLICDEGAHTVAARVGKGGLGTLQVAAAVAGEGDLLGADAALPVGGHGAVDDGLAGAPCGSGRGGGEAAVGLFVAMEG